MSDEYLEGLRRRAPHDDAAFAEYVTDGALAFPPHLREAEAFAEAHPSALILMPRGHAKTTLFVYRAARLVGASEGHDRVAILTAVDDDAAARSAAIRKIVEGPRFAELFPWARGGVRGSPWTDAAWTVRGAEATLGKDRTCTAMSIRSVRAGPRLDILLADDMVGFQENETAAQREKVRDVYFKVVDPMLVPGGRRWFLGTRWHEDDIYAGLIRQGWPHLLRRAIADDGTALWSDYWPLAALEERREQMGSPLFNLQYQNDPSGMGGNIFKRAWFQYVDALPARGTRRVGVDLASSATERSDYNAVGEMFEDEDHNLYVCGSYADRLDEGHRSWLTGVRDGGFVSIGSESPRLQWPLEMLPPGFAGATGHPQVPRIIVGVNVESVAFQTTFTTDLLSNTRLPARAVYPDKDKVTRARLLAARYEAGKVYHLRGAPGLASYEQEIVAFPNGEHDDRTDAMVYAADLGGQDFYWTTGRR